MITPILMPTWGLTMEEGTIVRWLVDEGAEIAPQAELVEIETTKIANVLEAQQVGILRRKIALPGQSYACGQLIGVIAGQDVDEHALDAFIAEFADQPVKGEAEQAEVASTPSYVDLPDNRQIRYLRLGDGNIPAVFVHGFGGDLSSWQFNQPRLSQERATYALDLLGHGGSSKVLKSGHLDELVAGVVDALDALGLGKVHLIGHSLGGAAALAIAATSPDRVATLSLIAPAGFGNRIDGTYIRDFIAAQRTRDLQRCLGRLFHNPEAVGRRMVDETAQYKRTDGVQQALQQIADACFGADEKFDRDLSRLAALDMPAMVIWGQEDTILSAEALSRLPAHVPGHKIEAAGHMPQMESAARVNELLVVQMKESDCV
jgi:pyruvate dehydrogenase E2 component (dihydrolipoamide acetyltransferase)